MYTRARIYNYVQLVRALDALRSCSVLDSVIEGSANCATTKSFNDCTENEVLMRKYAENSFKREKTSKSIFSVFPFFSTWSDFNMRFVSRTLTLTILNVYRKLLCVRFSLPFIVKIHSAPATTSKEARIGVEKKSVGGMKHLVSDWGWLVYILYTKHFPVFLKKLMFCLQK